ncbi:hypothetical protein H2203_005249 [Taxawa tesnikishii (nom. ined.)]|nr:hypothetical protein H2203_005249 [Dothideales sp. JES 119]
MKCNYDAPLGATRVQVLKDRNKELENSLHVALKVFDELRISSLPAAEGLLGRIRSSRSVQEFLEVDQEWLKTSSHHIYIGGCPGFGLSLPNASPSSSSGDEAENDVVVATNGPKLERVDSLTGQRDVTVEFAAGNGPFTGPQGNQRCASSLSMPTSVGYDTNRQYTSFAPPACFGNLPFSSAIIANGMSPDIQARQLSNFFKPEWLCESLLTYSDDPVSQMIQGFHRKTAELIAQGTTHEDVLGQSGLLCLDPFITNKPLSDPKDVPSWAANFGYSCTSTPIAEALVIIRSAAALMTRSLLLTEQTFAALPGWAKPTPLQQYVPHPAWIDFIPFPQLRDFFINHPDLATSPKWLPLLYQTFQCGWNFPIHDCICMDGTTRHTYLNPYFERHISEGSSFSVGGVLQQYIPQLGNLVPVRGEGAI